MYLGDAGAVFAFADALESEEELKQWAAGVKGPLLVWDDGVRQDSPHPARRGADVGGYPDPGHLCPVTALRVAAKATEEVFATIQGQGPTQVELLDWMRTREELYELIGYWEYERYDRELASPDIDGA